MNVCDTTGTVPGLASQLYKYSHVVFLSLIKNMPEVKWDATEAFQTLFKDNFLPQNIGFSLLFQILAIVYVQITAKIKETLQ